MVHFPGFARTRLCIYRAVIRFYRIGFPHSEIPGSMPTCGSPRLIAACHVLHRLLLPRHPPCALSSLTTKFTQLTRRLGRRLLLSAVSFASDRAGKFHDAFVLLIAPTVIADRGSPSRSKALIKHYSYSPCSYPMLFSCQKSSRLAASHTGWVEHIYMSAQSSHQATCASNRYRILRCRC